MGQRRYRVNDVPITTKKLTVCTFQTHLENVCMCVHARMSACESVRACVLVCVPTAQGQGKTQKRAGSSLQTLCVCMFTCMLVHVCACGGSWLSLSVFLLQSLPYVLIIQVESFTEPRDCSLSSSGKPTCSEDILSPLLEYTGIIGELHAHLYFTWVLRI